MIQNNIEQIRSNILQFSNDNMYIHTIMVLQRGKDGMPNKCLKQYHINNLKDYDKIVSKIPEYCDTNNARAYININPKNIRNVGFDMIVNLTKYLQYEQYGNIYDIFSKTIGNSNCVGVKKWIVDIDTTDIEITKTIIDFCKKTVDVQDIIKTKSGTHVITLGFNPVKFLQDIHNEHPETKEQFEILKDNPNTILYV